MLLLYPLIWILKFRSLQTVWEYLQCLLVYSPLKTQFVQKYEMAPRIPPQMGGCNMKRRKYMKIQDNISLKWEAYSEMKEGCHFPISQQPFPTHTTFCHGHSKFHLLLSIQSSDSFHLLSETNSNKATRSKTGNMLWYHSLTTACIYLPLDISHLLFWFEVVILPNHRNLWQYLQEWMQLTLLRH